MNTSWPQEHSAYNVIQLILPTGNTHPSFGKLRQWAKQGWASATSLTSTLREVQPHFIGSSWVTQGCSSFAAQNFTKLQAHSAPHIARLAVVKNQGLKSCDKVTLSTVLSSASLRSGQGVVRDLCCRDNSWLVSWSAPRQFQNRESSALPQSGCGGSLAIQIKNEWRFLSYLQLHKKTCKHVIDMYTAYYQKKHLYLCVHTYTFEYRGEIQKSAN